MVGYQLRKYKQYGYRITFILRDMCQKLYMRGHFDGQDDFTSKVILSRQMDWEGWMEN